MDFNELQSKLEGLSAAQLKLIFQVAWGELSEDRQEFLVKLASQMKKVNEVNKRPTT